MNRLRHWISGFFGFSRVETNAFLILLPLLFIVLFSNPLYRAWSDGHPREDSQSGKLDSLIATWDWEPLPDSIVRRRTFFAFNPNTASVEDLDRLGWPARLIQNLVHYRSKGGKFKIKKDLGRLFGMDSARMKVLYAYINLPESKKEIQIRLAPAKTHRLPVSFDLNRSDTTQLIQLYGIGPSLSRRIIRYRDRLGGFVSMNQLKEVYGLDSTAINELKRKTFITEDYEPRQLNINAADEKVLCSLPYIKFHLAKSIAAYRFQHGDFSTIDDLREVALINDTLFQKIKPYLTVNH